MNLRLYGVWKRFQTIDVRADLSTENNAGVQVPINISIECVMYIFYVDYVDFLCETYVLMVGYSNVFQYQMPALKFTPLLLWRGSLKAML